MYTLLDVKLDIEFIPYLVYDGNKTIKLTNNKLSKYVLEKKLKKVKDITKNVILSGSYIVKKYKFNIKTKTIKTTLIINPKYVKHIYIDIEEGIYPKNKDEKFTLHQIDSTIKNTFYYEFGDSKDLIGEGAPDGWMSGNITLILENEFNENMYEFGIATKKIKIKPLVIKKKRPSPTKSATLFEVDTIKKGNDNNRWIVKKVGKSVRWVKHNGKL